MEECLVKVNNFEFLIDKKAVAGMDIIRTPGGEYHLLKEGRSYLVRVLAADRKTLQLEVNGERFDLQIRDPLDLMMDKMGFSTQSSRHVKEVKAPMPGLVLSVTVEEGQEVKEGDKLLILEAMKMENSILISTAAVIGKILVKPGQAVEKGQVLIELD